MHKVLVNHIEGLSLPYCSGSGGGGRGCSVTKKKKKKYPRLPNEVKCKKATIACGIINISNYVNNFLSTHPTTLIFSSLESEF